jgi:hypothetical protein
MILPDETKAGTAGTQPCLAISRWAPRDDERGVLAPPNLHRIERPHALKTPIRRAESTSIARARYELMGLPIEGVEFLDAGVADKQRGFVWG